MRGTQVFRVAHQYSSIGPTRLKPTIMIAYKILRFLTSPWVHFQLTV